MEEGAAAVPVAKRGLGVLWMSTWAKEGGAAAKAGAKAMAKDLAALSKGGQAVSKVALEMQKCLLGRISNWTKVPTTSENCDAIHGKEGAGNAAPHTQSRST